MESINVAVVRGVVAGEPRTRQLPSGSFVTQFDVSSRGGGSPASVPISVHAHTVDAVAGDEVVVTGHVSRRFFRVGGLTQSRTEVVANAVIRVSRKKAVERALASVVEVLSPI